MTFEDRASTGETVEIIAFMLHEQQYCVETISALVRGSLMAVS